MPYLSSMSLLKNFCTNWSLPILGIVALSSCDMAFGLNKLNYSRLNMDLDTAWRKTTSYKYIPDTHDQWKSPREFEAEGGGDCEDFAIHLMYHLGDTSELYIVKLSGRKAYHAIVRYNGQYLEPQRRNRVYDPADFTFMYKLNYVASMLYVTKGGSKHLSASNAFQKSGLQNVEPSIGCHECLLDDLERPDPDAAPVSS